MQNLQAILISPHPPALVDALAQNRQERNQNQKNQYQPKGIHAMSLQK